MRLKKSRVSAPMVFQRILNSQKINEFWENYRAYDYYANYPNRKPLRKPILPVSVTRLCPANFLVRARDKPSTAFILAIHAITIAVRVLTVLFRFYLNRRYCNCSPKPQANFHFRIHVFCCYLANMNMN